MSTVELRTATADDVPAITALVQAAYGHYVERIGGRPRPLDDDYRKVVGEREVIVAEADGELAGLVVLGTDDEGFFIDNVAVAPAQQGAGVGRALLVRAEERAREAGHDSIWLLTHELMHENLALYERIGYVEYRRHDYGRGSLVYLRKSPRRVSARRSGRDERRALADPHDLVARRADAEQRHRHADEVLDEAQVVARCLRQLFLAAAARHVLAPAGQLLVDRERVVEHRLVVGERLERGAVGALVAGADLERARGRSARRAW